MSSSDPLSYRAPLEEYKQQADALFHAVKSGDEAAQWRFKWVHPRFHGKSATDVKIANLDLNDAHEVVAREYCFASWAALAEFTDSVSRDGPVARFEAAVEAVISGDVAALRSMLHDNPELVRARSTRAHLATLLHYIGANGVEGGRQKTPANAVEVAKILLDAGAEVDALADMYDNKCTTMSMLASSCHPAKAGLQAALAETLLDYGAALVGPEQVHVAADLAGLVADAAVERRVVSLDFLQGGAHGVGRHCEFARAPATVAQNAWDMDRDGHGKPSFTDGEAGG